MKRVGLLVALCACDGDPGPAAVDCTTLSAAVPGGRGELTGAWDPLAGRLVLFGGNQGVPPDCASTGTDIVAETWAFYPACDAFARIEGKGPRARARHATTFDPARRRMLVFGGRFRNGTSGSYTMFDDLWALDLATDTWTQLSKGGGPSARVDTAMAVVGDTLWLFGGNDSADAAVYNPTDDTWRFDLAGDGGWKLADTTGTPEPRLWHAAATDGASMYVFGGGQGFLGPFLNDLWKLDTGSRTWTRVHGSSGAPDVRFWPGLVWDDERDRLLMFGGHDNTDLGNRNDLWAYVPAKDQWRELRTGDVYANPALGQCDFPPDFTVTDTEAPERRSAAATVLADGELLVFGGKTDCGLINDVWGWDLADGGWTTHVFATQGESCPRAAETCTSLCF